ncbi:MAG: hypothetical protein RLN81_03025 [Balneolaceae bacterium]
MSKNSNKIDITDEIIETLLHHQHRTGVGPQKLFRGKRGIIPVGLSSSTVYNWIRRGSKTAKKDHLEFILSQWEAIPDNPYQNKRYKNYREGLEPIDPRDLEKLCLIRDMTGILPSKIFTYGSNPPSFLNANIVSQWISVEGYKARPEDVEWVLENSVRVLNETFLNLKNFET